VYFGEDSFGNRGCELETEQVRCPDIRNTGQQLPLNDDGEQDFALGFSFEFYGQAHSVVTIASNGVIAFQSNANIQWTNRDFGGNGLTIAYPALAAFWDDWHPGLGGGIYAEARGTAPNRSVVVQWAAAHYAGLGSATGDVRAVLYEGTNVMEVCYVDTNFGEALWNDGASATAGISTASSTSYLQYSFNSPVLIEGLFLRFTPP
jgi:hypothetical protein